MGVSRLIGIDQSGAEPNAFASTINYSLPFAYVLYLRYKEDLSRLWRKRVIVAYVLLSIICIFLTGSRAGVVILVLFTIFVWLHSPNKIRWLFVFILASVATWHLLPYEKKIRLETIWNENVIMEGEEGEKFMKSAQESTHGRTEGFWDGVRLLQRHPITGAGAGNFSKARQLVREKPLEEELEAHNLYGQLMGELGGIGIISFIFFIFSIIRLNITVIANKVSGLSPIAWACIITIVLLMINGMAGHNLYRYNWLWIAAFSSIQYGIFLRLQDKYRGLVSIDGNNG
jgi:O-antigen ligase